MEKLGLDSLVIIPQGFTKTVLEDKKPAELEMVSVLHNASMTGSLDSAKVSDILNTIQNETSNALLSDTYNLSPEEIETLKAPVTIKETTVVSGRSAEISSSAISSFAMMQSLLIPIIIFILVLLTSQMIITAISTEKIDKTLETLLSAPVSRLSVLGSKMLAAALVALLNAAVYMIGFSQYLGGMSGGMSGGTSSGINIPQATGTLDIASALSALGLQLSPTDYLAIGLQMFMTILISLALSLILGAMANDAKAAQTLLMPVMFGAMIPYMLQMFVSINNLPIVLRIIVYAIPFTHTFSAMDNLMFGNTTLFWGGLGYQVILFVIVMYFAVRLFTSDKIFTISLNLGQKARAGKNARLSAKK